MRVVLVGGGKIGKQLAETLAKEKNDVVLIEKEEKRAEDLAEQLDALVLHGDATEKGILQDADMEKCDALATVTSDDKTNLLVCEIAKSLNVPKIIARINDSANEQFFKKEGISFLVNTTTSAIAEFKNALEWKGRQVIGLVGDNQGEILEVYAQQKSKMVRMSVDSLARERIVVCGILRKGKFVLPKPRERIREKDMVVVCIPIGVKRRMERLLKV